MALIKCPDCEREISPRAEKCPYCGCPSNYFGRVIDERISDEKKERGINKENVGDGKTPKFGLRTEKYTNYDKTTFEVILDPERETDDYEYGESHVLFRLGQDKYISVAKDNLFYAPINAELLEQMSVSTERFWEYVEGASDLSEITDGVVEASNREVAKFIDFIISKLVHFGVYEYDLKKFASECGEGVLIENSDAYLSILSQINVVKEYAESLAYKRNVERASRSRWEGGGFGLKGAIKGAVTAGALNAATGAFRSIGDSITDSNDKSNIKNKLESIVNSDNKAALKVDFIRCLSCARLLYFAILHRSTGWDANGVMHERQDEYNAKLKNIDIVNDAGVKEKILFELLSQATFNNDVMEYALSNYKDFGIDISDLLHYVRRLNPKAYKIWMKDEFQKKLLTDTFSLKGRERISILLDNGISFGVIDNDYNIIEPNNGEVVVFCLIHAEMDDVGCGIFDVEAFFRDASYSEIETYFSNLRRIGYKYHVIADEEVKNKITLLDSARSYSKFIILKELLDDQIKKYCVVNDISCESLSEAKILKEEWDKYNGIFTEYDSYADYNSSEMQKVIDKMYDCCFTHPHIKSLVEGLVRKREKIEERERSVAFAKSQLVINRFKELNDKNMFVYGMDNFIQKAKEVVSLGDVIKCEGVFFPIVIYDMSNESTFKGFIITDNYFYSYNPSFFSDGVKKVKLESVQGVVSKGKNTIFYLSGNQTEKIKIVNYVSIIIDIFSEIYGWWGNGNKKKTAATNLKMCENCRKANETNALFCIYCGHRFSDKNKEILCIGMSTENSDRKCSCCGNSVRLSDKFCTKCGNKIMTDETSNDGKKVDDQKSDIIGRVCTNCGRSVDLKYKYCVYCGSKMVNQSEEYNTIEDYYYEDW